MSSTPVSQPKRRRVGLALSGGVARAPVHVGVLTVLEREGIPIDCIAGTSAGSIVGAAYCAGLPIPQLRALATEVGWRTAASLVWARSGFISFAKMESWIEEKLGVLDIRDLAIPFASVATDLDTGHRVILRQGRLATAVRASCSVPGIVTPVELDGRTLSDGGVVDNLPVEVTRQLGADVVIGVDLFVPGSWQRWGPIGALSVALETLIRNAGGGVAASDLLIVPELAGHGYLSLSKSEEYMAIGEAAAEKALPSIHKLLE